MYLILGDIHLKNEVNDRMGDILNYLRYATEKLGYYSEIHSIVSLGDVMDCEYVSYKKIVYFDNLIKEIKNVFSYVKNVTFVVGNHDKYSTLDFNNNVLEYISDDNIVSVPFVNSDGILFVPHFYKKENVEFSGFEDIKLILAHAGPSSVFGNEELTTDEIRRVFSINIPVIAGHLHLSGIDKKNNIIYTGSLKADSYNDGSLYSHIVLYDELHNKLICIYFPYKRIFMTIEEETEDLLKEKLINLFNVIAYVNKHIVFYKNDDNEQFIESDQWFTNYVNIKFIIKNNDIKPKNIKAIVDLAEHESDLFGNDVKIRYIIQMKKSMDSLKENSEDTSDNNDEKLMNEYFNYVKEDVDYIFNMLLDSSVLSDQKKKKLKKLFLNDKEKRVFTEYLKFIKAHEIFSKVKEFVKYM